MNRMRLHRRMGEDTWRLLDRLRLRDWEASALWLSGYGGLNYRARISDLRIQFYLEIQADSHRDPRTGKTHTIYFVPLHAMPRAEHLWRFKSLAGFEDRARQKTFF